MLMCCGVDLGISGKTAFHIVAGENFQLRTLYMQAILSIKAPAVEEIIDKINTAFHPNLFLLESNGPGGIFVQYLVQNKPHVPVAMVDSSKPPMDIELWDSTILTKDGFLNYRAVGFWLVHMLFRDKRITLPRDDPELTAQLTTLYYHEHPQLKKVQIVSKRKLKFNSSELGDIDLSHSPDKADALMLAALGYAVLHQQEKVITGIQMQEIIEPEVAGFFPIGLLPDLQEDYE